MTTPGLAAVRFLISKFATLKHGDARHCVTGMGAFLHGRARRPIFVHVLAEDAWCQEEEVLSILVGSLCWERVGFVECIPCSVHVLPRVHGCQGDCTR